MNHTKLYKTYLSKLIEMVDNGNLAPHIEILPHKGSNVGLEAVFDGIDVSSTIFLLFCMTLIYNRFPQTRILILSQCEEYNECRELQVGTSSYIKEKYCGNCVHY